MLWKGVRRYRRSLVGTAFAGAKSCYQQEGVLRNATALALIAEVSRKREHLNTCPETEIAKSGTIEQIEFL